MCSLSAVTTTDKLCVVCTTHKGLQGTFMSLKALCVVHTTHSLSVVVIAVKELSNTNVDNYMSFNFKKIYMSCKKNYMLFKLFQ